MSPVFFLCKRKNPGYYNRGFLKLNYPVLLLISLRIGNGFALFHKYGFQYF